MSQTQSSCSQLALHLSKNQAIRPCHRGVFLSGEAGTYSRRFGLSTTFFRPPKTFFGAPSGFPSGGAEAGIYSPPQDLSTVFFRASQVFSNPEVLTPSVLVGLPERSFSLLHPELPVNNLFSESKKKNRLVAGLPRRRVPATGTSVPQRRNRFMLLFTPPVNNFLNFS